MTAKNLIRWLAVLVCVASALVFTSLPNTEVAAFREGHAQLHQAAIRIENLHLPFSLVHLVFFAFMGFLVRISWANVSWRLLAVGFVVLSGLTEVLQWWAPGRTARWSDFWVDMAGAMAGVLLGSLLLKLARKLFRFDGEKGLTP